MTLTFGRNTNGKHGWKVWKGEGQHRNMPTQADGECCLRCFCLKQGLPVLRVVNRVFVQENYNTVIACLYICLFGQWGQEGREREATKKSMN